MAKNEIKLNIILEANKYTDSAPIKWLSVNSKPTPWKENAATEKLLKKLGCPAGSFTAMDTFATYVYVYGNQEYWFKSDGSVFSVNRNVWQTYKAAGNLIKIYDTVNDHKTWINTIDSTTGVVTISPNYKKYLEALKISQQKSKRTEWDDIKDKIQTFLDWFGFVPGLGDFADLINTMWYWYDGKKFDALCSAIGIIPFIGTALGKTLRVSGKGFNKLIKLGKNVPINQLDEAWSVFIKTVGLSPNQIRALHSGLGEVADAFVSFGKWANKNIPQKTFTDSIDDFNGFLKKSVTSIDNLSKKGAEAFLNKKGKKTIVPDLMNGTAEVVNQKGLRRVITKLTSLTFERSAKEAGGIASKIFNRTGKPGVVSFFKNIANISVKPRYARAISNGLVKSFIRKCDDPVLLASVLKTLPPSEVKALKSYIKGPTDDLAKFLTNLKIKHPAGYATYSKRIADLAMKNDNVFWNVLRTDPGQHIAVTLKSPISDFGKENFFRAIVSGKAFTDEFKDLFMSNITDIRKWVDIAANEVNELGSNLELTEDEKSSIIVSALRKGIRSTDRFKDGTGVIGKAKEFTPKEIKPWIDQATKDKDKEDLSADI